MNQELRERTVNILLPHTQTESARQTWISAALLGCSVLNSVNWSGGAREFTQKLLDQLDAYGECTEGKSAIVELLTALKKEVGFDRKIQIDELIAEIGRPSPSNDTEVLQKQPQAPKNFTDDEKDFSSDYDHPSSYRQARAQPIHRKKPFAYGMIILIGVIIVLILSNVFTNQGDITITPSQPKTPIITPSPQEPLITSNAQWQPYIGIFDDVEMVLVPAGCFDMGLNGAGGEQCFDAPFWIDRYEVSNDQFAVFGGEAGASSATTSENRPRTQVNWLEARQFCELRGARLPTEAEWEYAARGPDELLYPWGNEFESDHLVWAENSNNETTAVDSHPEGASWVGAIQMSGNVWEWVSSIFRDYPYDASDWSEDIDNTTDERVLRGGSLTEGTDSLSTEIRFRGDIDGWYYNTGFRCARDFEEATPVAP